MDSEKCLAIGTLLDAVTIDYDELHMNGVYLNSWWLPLQKKQGVLLAGIISRWFWREKLISPNEQRMRQASWTSANLEFSSAEFRPVARAPVKSVSHMFLGWFEVMKHRWAQRLDDFISYSVYTMETHGSFIFRVVISPIYWGY